MLNSNGALLTCRIGMFLSQDIPILAFEMMVLVITFFALVFGFRADSGFSVSFMVVNMLWPSASQRKQWKSRSQIARG